MHKLEINIKLNRFFGIFSSSASNLNNFSECELLTLGPTAPSDFKTQTAHGSVLPPNTIDCPPFTWIDTYLKWKNKL